MLKQFENQLRYNTNTTSNRNLIYKKHLTFESYLTKYYLLTAIEFIVIKKFKL